MAGAARRAEHRRTEIWMTAMLPHLKDPPSFREFVGQTRDKRADLRACLEAWDKVDRALAAR